MADARRFQPEHAASIKVIGVGGGGCNAVNRMIEAGLTGVEFYAVNSDVQALRDSRTENTVHIGGGQTRGLGAGANPTLGREAAEASREDLAMVLDGSGPRVYHCRNGRRNRKRRGAGHRRARARIGRADDRRRHQAVRVRRRVSACKPPKRRSPTSKRKSTR